MPGSFITSAPPRVRSRSRCSLGAPSPVYLGDDWRAASAPLHDKLVHLYQRNLLIDVTFHLYQPMSAPAASPARSSARRPRPRPMVNGTGRPPLPPPHRPRPHTDSESDSSGDSDSTDSSDSEAGPDLVVRAHRLVLAMASPVFERTLYADSSRDGQPIIVRNWNPGCFKLMIDFLYTGECVLASVESARDMFHIGRAFECAALVHHISQFVTDAVRSYRFTPLTCGSLFFFIEFAREVGDAAMLQQCWSYVDQYAPRIVATHEFNSLSQETVATMLDRETFDAGDELVVFLAVKRWGEHQLRERQAAGAPAAPLRDLVANLLPFVKMDRIDESDFIKTVMPSGLVGPQELVSFFMVRRIAIPRHIDLADSPAACRLLLEAGRRRSVTGAGVRRCLRYRAGYKLTRDDVDAVHELRFRCDADIQLVGVNVGYIFSKLELGLTVHVQGPFERVQWTDMYSQYHRVSDDASGAQPADIRVHFHTPLPIEGGLCYKVRVKVERWKYTAGDFNIWGGRSGPSRARSDDGALRFYFLQAAIEKGRDICFADMEKCRGLVTELLYTYPESAE